jgi:2-polyprenyl-3-methyl-5-hydroxy-6-metoxy-1,4-benzoquinol methylase
MQPIHHESGSSALKLPAADQVLLAAYVLAERNNRPAAAGQPVQGVVDFGPAYFGMYCADWSSAFAELLERGQARVHDDLLSLTPSGIARAVELQAGHPRYVYVYNEFFYRARRSAAHSRFCERVYGRDQCQHGMADMRQIEALVDWMRAGEHKQVLELGCGNGALAAYLAAVTGMQITGVDIAEEGIDWAQEFAAQQPERLSFQAADMLAVEFPAASFDAILLVDAVYFVPDLSSFLPRVLSWLRTPGQAYIFYSAWIKEAGQEGHLHPDTTALAKVLRESGLSYDYRDYSAAEKEHWQRKRIIAAEMKPEFEAEGQAWLHHRRWSEAEYHRAYVENDRVSRYLYRIR